MNTEQKNIWIINEYAGGPRFGMEFRPFYISRALQNIGYDVTIISASYSHLFKNFPEINKKFEIQEIDGIKHLWIKVPRYSSSHSKKRIAKWFVYTCSLFFLPTKKLKKPDYIIVSPMQTMPIYPAYRWAKKFNSKLIFEIKDIWPLSVIELGNYSPKHPFIQFLKYFEKFAIQKSDAIVSVLPNYNEYLKDEGYSKNFHYIPNGVDLEELKYIEPINPSLEAKIPTNKFIIGYTGTIGTANAMQYLIDAAILLKNNKNIYFVIVGEGSDKEKLIQQTINLDNIIFLNAIPKKQVQSILKKFDVCYMSMEEKSMYKYGISPNKIFDYMYAAKPILFCINSPNNVIELAHCGISVNKLEPGLIAEKVLQLYNMNKTDREKLGQNGKNFVMQNHTFEILARRYDKLFSTL